MSIFKETLHPFVQKQLLLRSQVKQRFNLAKTTNSMISWEYGKTAFVRMTSAVDVIDPELAKLLGVKVGNDMAKRHILQGGELFYENGKFSLRRGIGDGGGAYGDTSNLTRNASGIRPMAGINNISVSSRGAYGALRDVTVSFQCWSLQEMDRLSLLYQRPGYCILVEWGWTQYLDNTQLNGKYDHLSSPTLYNILDNPLQKQQIFNDLFGDGGRVEKGDGNYDAHMGYVRNFSAVTNKQQGWDCTVTIVSIGEIIDSLKMNYVSQLSRETILGFGQQTPQTLSPYIAAGKPQPIVTNTTELFGANDKKQPDSFYESKLAFIYDSILRQAGSSPLAASTNFQITKFRGAFMQDPGAQIPQYSNYPVYVGKLAERTATGATTSDEQFAAYISMKTLVDLINYSISVHDQTNHPFVYLSVRDRKGLELLCNSHYLQFSIDPRICVIKPCDNTNLCPPQIRTDHPELPNYFYKNGKYNMGVTGNIHINVRFLRNLIAESKNAQGYVDMSTYFNSMFSEINRALGGINNFTLYPDQNTDYIRIVDLAYLEDLSQAGKVEDKFILKLNTVDSPAIDFSIESKIYPSQSQISAIAAQAGGGGGVVGIESFTFDSFNRGIQDRIMMEKFEPLAKAKARNAQEQKRNDDERQKNWIDFVNRLSAMKALLTRGSYLPQQDISEGLHRLILDETRLQLENNDIVTLGSSGIIPILLTVKLPGIGGIVVGQIFRVNDDVSIPLAFRGGGKLKVGFIVKEVNHTIEGNDWSTDIVTQTCVLDSGKSDAKVVSNEIFKTIKFTKIQTSEAALLGKVQGK